VKVLRRFHRTVQNVGADSVRVVATSALRDARNSQAFLEWVRSATGWKVEIISGLEEARLIHLGLVSSLRVNVSSMLMVDLGGGSCELTISGAGHIRSTISLPLGAVRLTNEFLQHDPPRKPEIRQMRSFIARVPPPNCETPGQMRGLVAPTRWRARRLPTARRGCARTRASGRCRAAVATPGRRRPRPRLPGRRDPRWRHCPRRQPPTVRPQQETM